MVPQTSLPWRPCPSPVFSNVTATSHVWLPSTWNVAHGMRHCIWNLPQNISTNKTLTRVGKDVEKLEPLCTLLMGMENTAATMENSLVFLERIKHRITRWSNNLLLGLYPKELKARTQTDLCTLVCSQQHDSHWWKGGSNPSVHGWTSKTVQ